MIGDRRPLRPPPGGAASHGFTAEQEEAIARVGGWTLVSAAAGSGKTSVLTERIVRAVTGPDPVALGEILAITFTEKAAGELRGRVRAALERSAAPLLARDVEQATISTIHAFCGGLLRRHALAAGLDPGFQVLDATETALLREQAWERALAEWLDVGGGAALDVVAAHGVDRVAAAIAAVHDDLRSQGVAPALPAVAPVDVDALLVALGRAADEAAAEAAASSLPHSASSDAALEAVGVCRALVADWAPGAPPPDVASIARPPARNAARLALPAYVAYREALDRAGQGVGDARAAADYALLGDLLDRYAAAFAAAKRRAGGLDFEDLELEALAVLRRPAVQDRVRGRYRRVLLDEFQDTNPVQLEIARLVGGEDVLVVGDEFQSIYGFRHADVEVIRAVRRELAPAGRALSLTGNFRSDPRIVHAVNAAFAPTFGSTYVPMVGMREEVPASRGPVVELLVTDGAAWQGRKKVPEGTVLPEPPALGTTLPPEPAWRQAEARLLAQRLRDLLTEEPDLRPGDITILVRAYASMPVFVRALADVGLDAIPSGGRGYWSQQQVADLVAWLRLLANPADELALWDVLASPLVGVTTDTLALIALHGGAAELRPWPTLRRACAADGDGALLTDVGPEDGARLRAFTALLTAERAALGRHPLSALVARVVAASGYDERVLALVDGPRRLANVRKLRRLAATYEARHGRDLRGLLDVVAAERDAGDREPDAPSGLTDDSAVQLMTIHAAKGLEFPVVCVVDTGRRSRSDDPLLTVRDAKVGLKVRRLGEDAEHRAFDYEELKAAARQADADEQERLLYVALTRAERRLIVSGSTGQGGPLAWLGPALAPDLDDALKEPVPSSPRWTAVLGHGPTRVDVAVAINAPSTVGDVLRPESLAPPRAQAVAEAPLLPAPPPMRAPEPAPTAGAVLGAGVEIEGGVAPALASGAPAGAGWSGTVSYSSLGAYEACRYRWYLERVLGLPREDDLALTGQGAGLDPLVRGTIAHALLENLDFAAPGPPPAPAVAALARTLGAAPTPDEIEDLRAIVGAFARAPLCARLAAAHGVRREAGFAIALGAPAPASTAASAAAPVPDLSATTSPLSGDLGASVSVLTGVIDVVARESDGGAVVVDYKTDRVADAELEALVVREYGAQRELYALAALRAGAASVDVAHVFLERPAEPAIARYGATDVPALEERVRARLAGIVAGHFPVAERPHRGICARCPGRAALCSHPPGLTGRPREEASAPTGAP